MDRSMDNPGARDLEAELKCERLCRKNAEDIGRAWQVVTMVCAFAASLSFILGLMDSSDQADLASAAVHARDDARAAMLQERQFNDALMTASSDCEEGRKFWREQWAACLEALQ